MSVHVFSARVQPATRYRIDVDGARPFIVRFSPRRQLCCRNCGKRRWAKYLSVQVYYDMTAVFCSDGHGCKRTTRASTCGGGRKGERR